jgi:HAE1 family hydrophobic/amphiphilic exporter-1
MGLFTLSGLSIEQYPFLAPPMIRVTATYPGASAEAVEQSVATPIEQEVNGVDNSIYLKSTNTSDGRMQLDANFEVGTDQDTSNVLTQNRVGIAMARLPQEVTAQGVTTKKQSPSILMVISLASPNGTYDANFLTNYCTIQLEGPAAADRGVAQVDLFGGSDYSMRIWVRPDRLVAGPYALGRNLGHQGAEPAGAGGQVGAAPRQKIRSSPTRCARRDG